MAHCNYTSALASLINRGSFHGATFVVACGGADNVATCAKLLGRAELAGLITRGKYDPSREQRFFNVNHDTCLTHYHWITKTTKWLEACDLEVL